MVIGGEGPDEQPSGKEEVPQVTAHRAETQGRCLIPIELTWGCLVAAGSQQRLRRWRGRVGQSSMPSLLHPCPQPRGHTGNTDLLRMPSVPLPRACALAGPVRREPPLLLIAAAHPEPWPSGRLVDLPWQGPPQPSLHCHQDYLSQGSW